MWDWYWNLSGLTWLITTLALGAVNIGALGALVIYSAKSIAQSFDHDNKRCPCIRCERYRVRQINARLVADNHKPIIYAGQFISTRELGTGMVVTATKNGNTYVVDEVNIRSYGYALVLTNLQNNKEAWVTIMQSRAHLKLWKVADGRPKRIHAL